MTRRSKPRKTQPLKQRTLCIAGIAPEMGGAEPGPAVQVEPFFIQCKNPGNLVGINPRSGHAGAKIRVIEPAAAHLLDPV